MLQFRFPKDNIIRNKWITNMWRLESSESETEVFVPGSTARICTEHFTEDQVYRFGLTIRLRDGAIPTIFKSEPQVMHIKYINIIKLYVQYKYRYHHVQGNYQKSVFL